MRFVFILIFISGFAYAKPLRELHGFLNLKEVQEGVWDRGPSGEAYNYHYVSRGTFEKEKVDTNRMGPCRFPIVMQFTLDDVDPSDGTLALSYAGLTPYSYRDSDFIIALTKSGKDWVARHPGSGDPKISHREEWYVEKPNGESCAVRSEYRGKKTSLCFDGKKTLTVEYRQHETRCIYEVPKAMSYYQCTDVLPHWGFDPHDKKSGFSLIREWTMSKKDPSTGKFPPFAFNGITRREQNRYVVNSVTDRALTISRYEDGDRDATWTRTFNWPAGGKDKHLSSDSLSYIEIDTVRDQYGSEAIKCARTPW